MASPACMTWQRDLLSDVSSPRNHPFYEGQYYLLHTLNVGSVLIGSLCEKMNCRHNITIGGDHPKHHDVDKKIWFSIYIYIHYGHREGLRLFCELTI